MAYQLPPEIEKSIRDTAAREGVRIDELLRRTFAPAAPIPAPPKQVSQETPEETHVRVMGLLAERQKQYGLPTRPDGKSHTTLAELSAIWAAEDAHLTDEEWEAERQFWEDFNRERGNRPLQI